MKKGDFVSETNYLRIDRVSGDTLQVTDLDKGFHFTINGKILVDNLKSASDFSKTTKVTKTALAEKLTHCYNVVFTVCFEKANGDERVLRGRLLSHETLLGRSKVEDLDIDASEHRMRQVDHRTLQWLIVDGVKYELKGRK